MKSVCPTVCQKNENVLYTPCKPFNKTFTHPQQTQQTLANRCFKPLTKPLQTSSKPLRPLRGLHSLHLNKSKRGEYNLKLLPPAKGYLLNIQSKVFLVTLLSTPKEGNPAIQQTLAENLPFSLPP